MTIHDLFLYPIIIFTALSAASAQSPPRHTTYFTNPVTGHIESDSNANGWSDLWEELYSPLLGGTLDPERDSDSDGQTDFAEMLTFSDPTRPPLTPAQLNLAAQRNLETKTRAAAELQRRFESRRQELAPFIPPGWAASTVATPSKRDLINTVRGADSRRSLETLRSQLSKRSARLAEAKSKGFATSYTSKDGKRRLLTDFDNGRPVYGSSLANEMAVTNGVPAVRDGIETEFGQEFRGSAPPVGIWDVGRVLANWETLDINNDPIILTHEQFKSFSNSVSVTNREAMTVPIDKHATQMASIIMGDGNDLGGGTAEMIGMAPAAMMQAYDFDEDLVEIEEQLSTPQVAPDDATVLLSNHFLHPGQPRMGKGSVPAH